MKLQRWFIYQAGHLCMRKFEEQSAAEKGPGHHAGVVHERVTPERVIIFYLDTLNRVGVFFSDDFSFPLRRLLEAYLRWFMSRKKKGKKSWPNCCRDREALSVSVPLRCFQRWQRLREENTAQHRCPNPDQRGDNQSQSRSYSSKLSYMFASPPHHPTCGGGALDSTVGPRRGESGTDTSLKHWTGGAAGQT